MIVISYSASFNMNPEKSLSDAFIECKAKFDNYLAITKHVIDGHLESCMSVSEDTVDTCRCHYYMYVYPAHIIHQLVSLFIGQSITNTK